jgi:hypothetical protein
VQRTPVEGSGRGGGIRTHDDEHPKLVHWPDCATPRNYLSTGLGMDPLARRVADRFLRSFKYVPKETKEHKVERARDVIRQHTGLSKSMAQAIADAFVRGREVERLALQKKWPIENGAIHGPTGMLDLDKLPVD